MPDKSKRENKQKKARRRDKLIYGRHPVLETFQREIVRRVYIYEGVAQKRFFDQIFDLCKAKDIPLKVVDAEYLTSRLGKSNHQGILAEVDPFEYTDFKSLVQIVRKRDTACILVLAHLEDPGNLGAILRSAAAFKVSGIILPSKRSVSVNATVAKTSAGTLGLVPITIVPNLRNAVNALKEIDFWVVGADAHADMEISDMDFPQRSVIIMGGESKGVPPLLLKECDYKARINIENEVESLNVSAATAIFLHIASQSMRMLK